MLKNYKALISRAESYELDRGYFDYQEKVVTRKEDYIRLVFREAELPPIEDSVSFRKNYNHYSSTSLVIVVKRDSFFFGTYVVSYCEGRGHIYPVSNCRDFIYVESRKVNMRTLSIDAFRDVLFLPAFLSFFGLEAFLDDASIGLVPLIFRNKNIVGAIVKGTLTNWADAWKRYCRLVFGVQTDFKFVEQFVSGVQIGKYRYWNISHLIKYTTNWQSALKVLMGDLTSEEVCLYNDLLDDAFYLNKKVNLRWSIKRCQLEHLRNIDEILLAQEAALSDEPIHNLLVEDDTFDSDGTKFRILNTERSVFQEASLMHNCIYSHYFDKIREGQYLVLSTETENQGKIDIGYRWDTENKRFAFEQIHTIRNGHVPGDIAQNLIEKVDAYEDYLSQLHDELVNRSDERCWLANRPKPNDEAIRRHEVLVDWENADIPF